MKVSCFFWGIWALSCGCSWAETAISNDGGGQRILAAGGYHSLALDEKGTLWGWGCNQSGQIGDKKLIRPFIPIQMKLDQKIPRLIRVAAGEDHSLAISEDGGAWAWGCNGNGQLGNGTITDQSFPVEVRGLKNIVEVSGGEKHSIALDKEGKVWAWGGNDCGQTGKSKGANVLLPIEVSGLDGVIAISAGKTHNLALKKDGTVWTWGSLDFHKMGTEEAIEKSRQAPGLQGVKMIAAGDLHDLVLKNDGTVWAWGDNENGQLGDGTNEFREMPVKVEGLDHVCMISSGYDHCAALKEDGTVCTWGDNRFGQLGNTKPEASNVPVPVLSSTGEGCLVGIQAIACGGFHTLFLTKEGVLLACGQNYFGQLGDWKKINLFFPSKVGKQCFFPK